MVRRHVTVTLSIVDSEGLELVFSTSFLHCLDILRHSCTSDLNVSLTVSSVSLIFNVSLIFSAASENLINDINISHVFLACF